MEPRLVGIGQFKEPFSTSLMVKFLSGLVIDDVRVVLDVRVALPNPSRTCPFFTHDKVLHFKWS